MHVTVNLFATFREGRFKSAVRDYPPGTVVGEVLKALGIAEREVGMVFVNHRHAGLDRPLQEGDTLALFPPVGGG